MKRVPTLDVMVVAFLMMPAFGCGSLPMQSPALRLLERAVMGAEEPAEATARSEQALPIPHRLDEQPDFSLPDELLDELEEESGEGLSLEAAIERLLAANTDLAAKFQDIPKARAAVLTAGLRSDPVVFLTAAPLPYARFSAQRPGATAYDITFVQPLDLSGKHRTNKRVAEKSISILEAQYQDAIRLKIARLYTTYVNVLEARAAARAARANLKHLDKAAKKCQEQFDRGQRVQSDRTRVAIRQASARVVLGRAETALLHARRNLAVLLAIPADDADGLRVCGALRDRAPLPPPAQELIDSARQARPDLIALQLSVERAHDEVHREKAEAVDDFFCFFRRTKRWTRRHRGNKWPIPGRSV